eukprot:CAMPEP_0202959982 /NCGR_PEP_ID=MMETSP1396-20130829/4176_1 /ASSEMBLY_ACC=CAM_ASM_000872 /TAXON_ID= /ORGANISM="Pseudokeronopsis sp., Strain Brazil" /LENGTH=52 /DNA_ID=CAMNT_0049678925 /DNA_START=1213 /DNA_END=1371 /DNA_ORIENTATION=-
MASKEPLQAIGVFLALCAIAVLVGVLGKEDLRLQRAQQKGSKFMEEDEEFID